MSCRIYSDNGAPSVWLIEAAILRALKPAGILFLCVANSARSQIAQGIAQMLAPENVKIQSAGSTPTDVRPEAITILKETGADTSKLFSKSVSDIDYETVDTVITLCKEEECPFFLGKALRVHWELEDPAAVTGSEQTRLDSFRATFAELKKRIGVIFDKN
jgi:arsenate reductase